MIERDRFGRPAIQRCEECGSTEFVNGPNGRRCAWLFSHGLRRPPRPEERESCKAKLTWWSGGEAVEFICERFAHDRTVRHRATGVELPW